LLDYLKGMSVLALLASQEVANHKVAVVQSLQAGDPGEIQLRHILRGEFPNNFADRIHLDHALLDPTRNQRIAIGKARDWEQHLNLKFPGD